MDKKEYHREYHKKWYANPGNRARQIAQAAFHKNRNKARNRAFIEEYKQERGCQCGENHPACLDFHHLDPTRKRRTISEMIHGAYSLEVIEQELEQCLLICRNCHAKLHYEDRL
jgi:hypothetical protein